MSQHVLALVFLDKGRRDSYGHIYPESGFIEADNFNHDNDLRTGLYGVLWGAIENNTFFNICQETCWVVVKISRDSNYILLDKVLNIIKFRDGMIVHSGTKFSASKFIKEFRTENLAPNDDFYEGEIAGGVCHSELPNRHALAAGFSGFAVSHIGGMHSISSSGEGKALTTEVGSHAVGLGSENRAAALDDDGHAVAIGHSSVAKTCGHRAKAVTLGSFSKSFSTGDESLSVCLEPDGTGSVGINGALIMAYRSGGRIKYAIGYGGEDIIPNRMYRCEDGQFLLVV